MKLKGNINKESICMFIGTLAVGLSAIYCTEIEIDYTPYQKVSVLQINPDQSTYTLPAMQYYFYDPDTFHLWISDDNGNFMGSLPMGIYRVLATNAYTRNVTFSGMQSYRTAVAEANPELPDGRRSVSRAENYTMLLQPDSIYSIVIEELVDTVLEPPVYRPAPVLLTKQLELAFNLRDDLESSVVGLKGVLPGIYPSISLNDRVPTGESLIRSLSTATRFEASGQGSARKAPVSLWGIRNPEYGSVYRNALSVYLSMNDGSEQTVTVDMTGVLTDIMRWNQGVIPRKLILYIEIKRAASGIGVEGAVTAWNDEGETEVIV
jgi:hypothetical protein